MSRKKKVSEIFSQTFNDVEKRASGASKKWHTIASIAVAKTLQGNIHTNQANGNRQQIRKKADQKKEENRAMGES